MPTDNRRIAKNTLLLYFRMIFLTLISIFTVRVTLEALGIINYGISNVVGSVVLSLSFVTGTLSSATQRYLSFSLGKKDLTGYRNTFSLLLLCYLVISAIVFIIGEVAGHFFINDWLEIPNNRLYAAKWYYQSCLFSFIFMLLSIPYTSSLIAHEKMGGFAYISIADGIFKLGIAYAIFISKYDKLILYGFLSMAVSAVTLVLYMIYCRRNFDGCRFKYYWERGLFKELMSFTGWNLFGSVSGVLATQGQNILLNVYFGPIINAAKAISDKISNIIQSFSTNFYLAVSPQIIKSYANDEKEDMFRLVISSTKFSYYLLMLLSYPLILCMDVILTIWLGSENVTDEMIIFGRLALVFCLVASLEQPITQMIRATGNIKRYQVSVGTITLSFLPFAAIALYLKFPPQSTMYVLIIIYIVAQIIRIFTAKKQVGFPVRLYIIKAIIPIVLTSIMLEILAIPLSEFHEESIPMVALKLSTAFIAALATIIFLGMSRNERALIIKKIRLRLFNG